MSIGWAIAALLYGLLYVVCYTYLGLGDGYVLSNVLAIS